MQRHHRAKAVGGAFSFFLLLLIRRVDHSLVWAKNVYSDCSFQWNSLTRWFLNAACLFFFPTGFLSDWKVPGFILYLTKNYHERGNGQVPWENRVQKYERKMQATLSRIKALLKSGLLINFSNEGSITLNFLPHSKWMKFSCPLLVMWNKLLPSCGPECAISDFAIRI